MPKEKRATWWKMLYHQRAAISSVSDEDAGKGLKAAFAYFDGDEVDTGSLTPGAFTVFCVIRPYIDESIRDFEDSVACGKGGTIKRWGENSPPIGGLAETISNIITRAKLPSHPSSFSGIFQKKCGAGRKRYAEYKFRAKNTPSPAEGFMEFMKNK